MKTHAITQTVIYSQQSLVKSRTVWRGSILNECWDHTEITNPDCVLVFWPWIILQAVFCIQSVIRYAALYCHKLSIKYYWWWWSMRWWYVMFRFWPSMWSSSSKLRSDGLCLENRGQSWTKEPRSCLCLILEFRSEEEELSIFILNTAAYVAGLPATDLAKSGTKEQTQRVRERKTVLLTFILSQYNLITAI